MQPTDKHPAIDAFLTRLTGKDRREMVTAQKCTTCPDKAEMF